MNIASRLGFMFVFICVVCSADVPAFTDETQLTVQVSSPEKSLNIRANPVGLLFSVGTLEADFKIGDRFTVGPMLGYASREEDLTDVTMKAFTVGARGIFYLTGAALTESWYVSGFAGYLSASLNQRRSSADQSAFLVGATSGYQWVWHNGINLTLGAGALYSSLADSVTAPNGRVLAVPGLSGVLPAFDCALGITL